MKRVTATVCLLLLGAAVDAGAITRDQVMARARAFANHLWRCKTANLTAGCSSSYKSEYLPGDQMGLPYDWGGYMTLFEFDQQIAQGYGAGSHAADGVLSCTAGLDCSGYVSKCWDTGHWSTKTLSSVSSTISKASLLPGDAYNLPGSHVVLYSHTLASGEPIWYEAAGYNVHINVHGGWSKVSGYTPIRHDKITGGGAGNPVGTTTNPIVITSLPYSDARDTSVAVSDVLDGCGAAPTKDESGPEVIYKLTLTKPGTLTVAIADDAGADIDPHLYGSLNTGDCLARHDSALSHPVDCGTYYIVADTFRAGGQDLAGKYSLTVSFAAAAGASCGAGPPSYAPPGKPGDACAYPGNPNLPPCNPNLGATSCIHGGGSSFCSLPCTAGADCAVLPGGCCKDIGGKGEYYCMTAAYCGTSPKLDAAVAAPDAGPPPDGTTPKADGGGSPTGNAGQPTTDGSADGSDQGPGTDGSAPPGPGATDGQSGCGCGAAGSPRGGGGASGLAPLLLAAALALARRRRRYLLR